MTTEELQQALEYMTEVQIPDLIEQAEPEDLPRIYDLLYTNALKLDQLKTTANIRASEVPH